MKIGIFGGYFNPLHYGHINSCLNVKKNFNLDHLYIVPTLKPVHKKTYKKILNKDRYLMIESFFSRLSPGISVHDYEFRSEKPNHSIHTIEYFLEENPKSEVSFIMGVDQFLTLDSWQDIDKILKISDLIVTSRSPYPWPVEEDRIPESVKSLIKSRDENNIYLTTGKKICFYKLEDISISSSEVRDKVSAGREVINDVPKEINKTIIEKDFYVEKKTDSDFEELAYFCNHIIQDKQGYDVAGWDFTTTDYISDFVIIASAKNKTHCHALSEHIKESVRDKYKMKPKSLEGLQGSEWVIVDYGGLVIHLFYDYVRNKYQLEELLQSGKPLPFSMV